MLTTTCLNLIDGLTFNHCRKAVWALHHNRCDLAALELSADGIDASPKFVRDLGELWATAFGLYTRQSCFLCGSTEKKRNLCLCYDTVAVAVPTTPAQIQVIKEQYPDRWGKVLADRCQCTKCFDIFSVPVSVIDSRLRQNKAWSTPKFCKACWVTKPAPVTQPRWAFRRNASANHTPCAPTTANTETNMEGEV